MHTRRKLCFEWTNHSLIATLKSINQKKFSSTGVIYILENLDDISRIYLLCIRKDNVELKYAKFLLISR